MANLHATMTNSRGNTVSTTNSRVVDTMVETWSVRIKTYLWADGTYSITVSERNSGREIERLDGQYPPVETEVTA